MARGPWGFQLARGWVEEQPGKVFFRLLPKASRREDSSAGLPSCPWRASWKWAEHEAEK